MADQEFLASFGVEIDETGPDKLQMALKENRALAEELDTSGAEQYLLRTLQGAL